MTAESDTGMDTRDMMTLSDGTEARVRAISPDDGPALLAFHQGLSDRSRGFGSSPRTQFSAQMRSRI